MEAIHSQQGAVCRFDLQSRCLPALAKSVTMRGMRFPGYIGIARTAFPVVILLACLGTFLYPVQLTQFVTGTVGSPDSPVNYSPHRSAEMPGGGGALTDKYFAVSIDETGVDKQRPLNGEYLTALLLMVLLGVAFGFFGGGRMWRRDRILVLSERLLPSISDSPPRKPACPILSVFLL